MTNPETVPAGLTVGDIGCADLAGVQSHASMSDAIEMMLELNVGAVVVFEGSTLIGIVTERDVMHAAHDGASMDDASVLTYMTVRPSTIRVDADVAQAALAMRALHTRHLPVVNGTKVVGMISSRDLLEALDPYTEIIPSHRREWNTLWRKRPRILES